MPTTRRAAAHGYGNEEEDEDNFFDDEHEGDEDKEEEDDNLFETLEFEARILNDTFNAYHMGFSTHTTIKQLLPTILELWEVVELTALQFANGLQDILQSPTPPTPEDLTNLPDYKTTDPYAFTCYMLILQHAGSGSGSRPLIYIGTGTDQKKGVEPRFRDYDREKNLSTYTQEAYDNGYKITHKKVLVSAKIPDTSELSHAARGLFKMLETSLSYMLHAYKEPKFTHPMFTRYHWSESITYGGCVHHDAWCEGLARSKWFFSGLTQAEIAEIQRVRRNEKRAENNANETPEEKKQRQFAHNKWRRDRDATESPETRNARRAKELAWMRNHLANETPEQRKARLETKKRRRENETPEKRKARLAHHKEYIKNRLANETKEEREARLAKKRESDRKARENKTPEQRARKNARDSQRQKDKKAAETKEERAARLLKQNQWQANKYANETPAQREKRLAGKRESDRKARERKRAAKRLKME